MSIVGKKRKSDIDDVIRYELVDFPPWRDREDNLKSVTEMINEIAKFHDKWNKVKDTKELETIKRIQREMEVHFYFHVNKEEEHGLSTFQDTDNVIKSHYQKLQRTVSKSEQEVLNLYRSYEKLKDIQQKTEEATPLLDGDILKAIHKILLEGINKDGNTEPGNYSQGIRITVYKDEIYKYKNINGLTLEQSVQTILDRYNHLIDTCKSNWQWSSQDSLADLFKIAAYLLFEMLDVHPFADGNGRLCRMLVSYALSFATPFPSSVYNVWSDITNKDAYIDAIMETRRSATRHPHLLAAMIAECNWYAWRKFFEKLDINIDEL